MKKPKYRLLTRIITGKLKENNGEWFYVFDINFTRPSIVVDVFNRWNTSEYFLSNGRVELIKSRREMILNSAKFDIEHFEFTTCELQILQFQEGEFVDMTLTYLEKI